MSAQLVQICADFSQSQRIPARVSGGDGGSEIMEVGEVGVAGRSTAVYMCRYVQHGSMYVQHGIYRGHICRA
jgi:hypothetical protein